MQEQQFSVTNQVMYATVDQLKAAAIENKTGDFGVKYTWGPSEPAPVIGVGAGSGNPFGVSVGIHIPTWDELTGNTGSGSGSNTGTGTGTGGSTGSTSAPAGGQNSMPVILGVAGVALVGVGLFVMLGGSSKKGKK